MMRLILGSGSPRRKEILDYFSLPFEQVPPPFDEEIIPYDGDPVSYVQLLSEGKASSLQHLFPESAILTADTVVWQAGSLYGKPKDEEEAVQILTALAGQWHSVFTGLTLKYKADEYRCYEETRVLFNTVTPSQIRHYQSSLHCADKAGGYAIQKAGGLIVNRIEGCYYNVMGLPINSVHKLLSKIGIELWDYLK